LIIVLISIVVLSVLAAGFAYSMKVETRLARNASYDTELEWLGRSGVEYARWGLGQQFLLRGCEPYDALTQKWAGGPGGICTSNNPLADVNLYEPVRLSGGQFTITKITDLERKININLVNEVILQQALTQMGLGASESATTVNSILDWIDRDDVVRVNGAESDYYQALSPPYVAKNGPLDDILELLLIKGVTQELFWGPACTNHTVAAFQVKGGVFRAAEALPTYPFGLVDVFTTISSGRVNINTASAEVLQAIPGIDQNAAQRIIEFRNMGEGMQETMPIGSPGKGIREALLYAGFSNQGADQAARFFDVRSRTFEVRVTAEMSGYSRHFVAILGRNSARDVQILSFYSIDPQ
jgi:general secretion pathway protein K